MGRTRRKEKTKYSEISKRKKRQEIKIRRQEKEFLRHLNSQDDKFSELETEDDFEEEYPN